MPHLGHDTKDERAGRSMSSLCWQVASLNIMTSRSMSRGRALYLRAHLDGSEGGWPHRNLIYRGHGNKLCCSVELCVCEGRWKRTVAGFSFPAAADTKHEGVGDGLESERQVCRCLMPPADDASQRPVCLFACLRA
jgi:hypothetical protein